MPAPNRSTDTAPSCAPFVAYSNISTGKPPVGWPVYDGDLYIQVHMMTSKKDLIIQWLRERIEAGTYPMGTLLPSENQLAELMGVSRPTVRTALNTLVQQGLALPMQGVGYQVIAQKPASARMVQFDSLGDLVEFNHQYPRRVLEPITTLGSAFLERIGFAHSLQGWSGVRFERQLTDWKPRSYVGEILIHPLFTQQLAQFESMDAPYFKAIEKSLGSKLHINQYITILDADSPLKNEYLDPSVNYFDIYRIYSNTQGDAYQISRNIISSENFYCQTIINDS